MVCVPKFTKLYAAAFALVIAILGICIAPSIAHAINVDRTGVYNVEGADIGFDYILGLHNASEITCTGGYSRTTKTIDDDGTVAQVIYHNGSHSGNQLNGSATIRWNNVGVDLDGDRVDLICTMTVTMSNPEAHNVLYDWYGSLCTGDYDMPLTWYRFDCKLVKRGTSNLATGKYLLAFRDIDVVTDSVPFRESIKLYSGYDSNTTVYVEPNSYLRISENNTLFEADHIDEDSYRSGFVVPMNAEFSFGNCIHGGCGTLIFEPFNNYKIISTAHEGGSTTFPGEVHVAYHGNRTYTITPAKYYKTKSVSIDGVNRGAISTYSFDKVEANHTVEAWFEALSGTVKLQKRDAATKATHGQGSATLEGTKFEITCVDSPFYENGSVVATLSTNANGYVQTNLQGGKFEVREVEASRGYALSDTSVKTFEIITDGQVVDLTDEANSFYNTASMGGVQFRKLDADSLTGFAEGDATLAGAIFNVYNVNDTAVVVRGIIYPTYKDLKKASTGKFGSYDVGEYNINPNNTSLIPCYVLTTDSNGVASTLLDLPLGKYVICEKSAPTGYLVNETLRQGISFEIVSENEMVAFITQ